jgi:hypothetical protein
LKPLKKKIDFCFFTSAHPGLVDRAKNISCACSDELVTGQAVRREMDRLKSVRAAPEFKLNGLSTQVVMRKVKSCSARKM